MATFKQNVVRYNYNFFLWVARACVANHYVIALKCPYGSTSMTSDISVISLPPQSSATAMECLFGFILDFAFRYVSGLQKFEFIAFVSFHVSYSILKKLNYSSCTNNYGKDNVIGFHVSIVILKSQLVANSSRVIATVTAQKFEYKCEMQFHVLIKLYHSLFLLVILSSLKILTCTF